MPVPDSTTPPKTIRSSFQQPLALARIGALGDLVWAVDQARDGKVAVLTLHAVPVLEHPWVHAEQQDFLRNTDYLQAQERTVSPMRDPSRYVHPDKAPSSP